MNRSSLLKSMGGILFIVQMLVLTPAFGVTISKISANHDPSWDRVRIFMDTKSEPSYKTIRMLSNPPRVLIEMDASLDGVNEGTYHYDDSFFKSLSIQKNSKSRVTLVATLAAACATPKISFYRNSIQEFLYVDIPRPDRYQQPTWTWRELQNARNQGKPIVVLDPGHGGYDPGAISRLRSSLKEKDVVMDVSLKAVSILKRKGKVYPVLTRSGDFYPTLDERVDLIAKTEANLFISIHADSSPNNREASGFGIWILPETNESAASEARRLLKYGWQTRLANLPLSRQTLMMKRQERFVEDETQIAADIMLAALDRVRYIENRGIKKNNFKVLRHHFAPSMLVELGFLSNLSDSRKLDRELFREEMAQALANGIESYFSSLNNRRVTPPISPSFKLAKDSSPEYRKDDVDSLLVDAANASTERTRVAFYKVTPSDTLLRIAHRHNTTISEILRLNGWSDGYRPKSGQEIFVPATQTTNRPNPALALRNLEEIFNEGNSLENSPDDTVAEVSYEVQPGDTLSKIATRFGTTPTEIRRYNRLRTDMIRVGQPLKIPTTRSSRVMDERLTLTSG